MKAKIAIGLAGVVGLYLAYHFLSLLFSGLMVIFAPTLMLSISFLILYFGIVKKYEPLLLIPIGFGVFLANLPGGYMTSSYLDATLVSKMAVGEQREKVKIPHPDKGETVSLYYNEAGVFTTDGNDRVLAGTLAYDHQSMVFTPNEGVASYLNGQELITGKSPVQIHIEDGEELRLGSHAFNMQLSGGLLNLIYVNLLKSGFIPPLIFMGVGAMTDFGPLLRNMGLAFYGAAAQLGIFAVFLGALLAGFTMPEAASLGIIGGADGPTAIFLTTQLAPHLLGPIAVAAYSYMSLVPIIIPLVANRMTTPEERRIHMRNQEMAGGVKPVKVSRRAKVLFPIMVTLVCGLLVSSSVPLVGMLMFGNLVKEVSESSVNERLAGVSKGALINILTIFLGLSVGSTMDAATFLDWKTIGIIVGGFFAFCVSVGGGITGAKIYNKFAALRGWKLTNPLIGATGLSAVPMASRVANEMALKEDPTNNILHYCMSSNVAGVIGSAVAAGYFLDILS